MSVSPPGTTPRDFSSKERKEGNGFLKGGKEKTSSLTEGIVKRSLGPLRLCIRVFFLSGPPQARAPSLSPLRPILFPLLLRRCTPRPWELRLPFVPGTFNLMPLDLPDKPPLPLSHDALRRGPLPSFHHRWERIFCKMVLKSAQAN